MKSRSAKIGKVVSIAQAEEQRLGQHAGRSRRQLDEQLARLGELSAFRREYAGKTSAHSTVRSAHWQDYQAFLGRLDAAVKAQQQIVQDCERNLATHRQRWMAKRQRVQSLERVVDKYQTEERQQEARQEQKRLDDLGRSQNLGFDPEVD